MLQSPFCFWRKNYFSVSLSFGFGSLGLPLPMPNKEVKPLMADGTAQKCGRVGSCHIHLKKPFRKLRGFFVFKN